jgi:hypothetical protein
MLLFWLFLLQVDDFKAFMETFQSDNFDIAYSHFNSMDEELDRNIKGDITLFSITMTLMITYACVATLSSRLVCYLVTLS